MKKVLLCLLIVLMTLTFISCDYIIDNEHNELVGVRGTGTPGNSKNEYNCSEHTFIYVQNDNGHFKQYTCGCPSPDIFELHADEDDDGKCDICDYVMSNDCPYRYSIYEEGHSLVMLCDCHAAPAVIDPHEDSDGDSLCDDCGYQMSEYLNYLAQIVIDYEQSLKNEINELEEKHPEYNYFYYPVDRIWCAFMLENDASAEDIVEKYDMENMFSMADVRPYNTFKMIDLYFDRNDFTESIYRKINEIGEEDPQIQSFFIEMEREIFNSYMPDIEYYANTPISIIFEKTESIYNDSTDQSFIIKSKDEYDEYINYLLETAKYEYIIELINTQKDLYDESFFDENALIITKTITRGSGSIALTVNNVYVSDNNIYVVVKTDVPQMGTDDMQYRSFTLVVSKTDVIDVVEVITLE